MVPYRLSQDPADAAEEYNALAALPLEPLGDGAYARSVVLAQGGCYAQARTTFESLTGRFSVKGAGVHHQVVHMVQEATQWFLLDELSRCEEVLMRASRLLEGVKDGPLPQAWEPVLEIYVHLWLQKEQPVRAFEAAAELRSRCGTQASAPLMAWCLLQLNRPLEAKQWASHMNLHQQNTPMGRVLDSVLRGLEGSIEHGECGM